MRSRVVVWHGHIERTPVTVITYGTRNVGEVLIHIDDADGQLLPDTNVTVTDDDLEPGKCAQHSQRGAAI